MDPVEAARRRRPVTGPGASPRRRRRGACAGVAGRTRPGERVALVPAAATDLTEPRPAAQADWVAAP